LLAIAVVAGAAAWFLRIEHTRSRSRALDSARRGDFEQALPALNRSLERRPDDVEVLEVLARGHLQTGDEIAAAAALDGWIAAAPQDSQPLRLRMEQRTKLRNYDAALADGVRLRELNPADPELRRRVMGLAQSAGSFELAERLCREALEAEPGDVALRLRLASIRAHRGEAAEAAKQLEGLLADRPGHTGVMQALAMLYNDLGQPEKAVPLLQAVMQYDSTRQRTAGYQLSLALERCGRQEEAKKVLQEVRRRQNVEVAREALEGQPDNLDLRVRLAEAMLADGSAADGITLLDETLARDPSFKPAHRALADHYAKSGDAVKSEHHRKLAGGP
jgi:predicted Zn-dependent protease